MFHHIFDCLFPIQCVGCGQWDQWLCDQCQLLIAHPQSKLITTRPPATLYSLGSYQQPVLKQAIHTLKYNSIQLLGTALGQCLAAHVPLYKYDYCVAIPLHKSRLQERGFNQSLVIAQQLRLPVLPALERLVYTTPQAQLNRTERIQNMQQVFSLNPNYGVSLYNKNLLLIDDVYTTGSTVLAARQILLTAGAATVDAAVLAID